MEYNSEEIRKTFEEKLESISEQEVKNNKIKIGLLYTTCITAFVFMFAGMIFSLSNYQKAKENNESNVNVIQNVVVKEY